MFDTYLLDSYVYLIKSYIFTKFINFQNDMVNIDCQLYDPSITLELSVRVPRWDG